LVVLGLQLAALPIDRRHWKMIGTASALRLALAPLLALALAVPLGLSGLARQVGVLQAAVPTAVTASIIASRYDSEPNQVAGSVLVTSLVSLISVTALLSWMV
jgi:malate permease and related proteins